VVKILLFDNDDDDVTKKFGTMQSNQSFWQGKTQRQRKRDVSSTACVEGAIWP
jgi:hypothetical protein